MLVATKNFLAAAVKVIAGFASSPPQPAPTILLKATGVGTDGTLATAYSCQVGGPFVLVPGALNLKVMNNVFVANTLNPSNSNEVTVPIVGHANGSATIQIKVAAAGVADASGLFNWDPAADTGFQIGVYTPTAIGVDGQVGIFGIDTTFSGGSTATVTALETFILVVHPHDDTINFSINGAVQTPIVIANRPQKTVSNWGMTLFGDDTASSLSNLQVSDEVV